jgi:hypothetical protein
MIRRKVTCSCGNKVKPFTRCDKCNRMNTIAYNRNEAREDRIYYGKNTVIHSSR